MKRYRQVFGMVTAEPLWGRSLVSLVFAMTILSLQENSRGVEAKCQSRT